MSLHSRERSVEDGTMQTTRDLLTITVSSHFDSETFPCVLIRTKKETLVFYINNQGGTSTLPLLRLSYSLLLWCTAQVVSLDVMCLIMHLISTLQPVGHRYTPLFGSIIWI